MKINTTKRPYVSPRMVCVALAAEDELLTASPGSSLNTNDEMGDTTPEGTDEYVREERPMQWKSTVWD